ncbi:MAG: SAM-dependent methyltransferase [Planctomycetota bacterium]|jgi:SAM-dependent methyltransferase
MPSTPKFCDMEDFEGLAERQVGHDYNKQCEVEYNAIKGYLGEPKRTLELGCGLGRMSVYLNWKFDNPETHFTLADANEVTHESNISGWNPGRDFYNNLDTTKAFCNKNGLKNLSLFDIHADDVKDIGKIDLLYSFLAVGFHFPIEESLAKFWPCLSPDSTLIFGVRQKRYSIVEFADYFEESYLVQSHISDYPKQTRKQHFLILKGPRDCGPPSTEVRRRGIIANWQFERRFWQRTR